MLWTDDRIEKHVSDFCAGDEEDYMWWQTQMEDAMQEVRDEYERTIGTMREDAVRSAVAYEARIAELEKEVKAAKVDRGDYHVALILENAASKEKDARIAKLEAAQQDLLRNLKNSGGSYYTMQQQYGVIFAENCELQGRIVELEAKLDKAKNEIIMESGERAAYQVSCAELEAKLATSTELEEAHLLEIDRLADELNSSRQRDIARF